MNENKQLPSVVVPWVVMVHCLLLMRNKTYMLSEAIGC